MHPGANSNLVLWSVSLPFPFFSCTLGTRSNPLVSPIIEIRFCVFNIELPLQVKYSLMHPEPIVGSCYMASLPSIRFYFRFPFSLSAES